MTTHNPYKEWSSALARLFLLLDQKDFGCFPVGQFEVLIMSQLPVEEALKDLLQTEETKRRVLEWIHSMESDSLPRTSMGIPVAMISKVRSTTHGFGRGMGPNQLLAPRVLLLLQENGITILRKYIKGRQPPMAGLPVCLKDRQPPRADPMMPEMVQQPPKSEVMIPLVRYSQSHQLARVKRG